MSEKDRQSELADFLKTRRAKISPSQVGLPQGGRRRTPGLRREEVAQLAGIGITWYTWLEQGRPIQVSAQILESLSRVFMLTKEEKNHLYILAKQLITQEYLSDSTLTIDPGIQHVLDSLIYSPAFLMDHRWNFIAWNKAACRVFGDYSKMDERNRNIIWSMFTNPEYKSLFVGWEYHAKGLLARFRATSSRYIEDTWFREFIEELKGKSNEFAAWWPRHEVESISVVHKEINHKEAGKLIFEFHSFDVSDMPDVKLMINTPLSGTDTKNKMGQLLEE